MSTVWEIVSDRASLAPDTVALVAPNRNPLSYRELADHVVTTASALRAAGVGPGNRVCVALPNGPELATAFLSVASCATCAPLNPLQTVEQIEFSFDNLQASAVIVPAQADSPFAAVGRRLGIQVLELEASTSEPAGRFTLLGKPSHGAGMAPAFASADDVALVLHTSGTTARPKQVPLTHRNLVASAHAIASWLQLSPADRGLNIMPLFHIHGLVAGLLAPLSAGSSVACTAGLGHGDFFEWLDALHPTWYTAVPTLHQAILDGSRGKEASITRNPLRFIRSSSAALPSGLASALERCFNAPVVEAYGMTEASHQIASNPLPPGARKLGSVGLAAGPEVGVMDDEGHLLPAATTGEIVIRGQNVTGGYNGSPEANARAFASGWFRTGDQGFIDDTGYVYLTGRLKEIINRGGEKVSPREIDEALLEHAAVGQAVSFRVPHPTLGEDIAAAVVLKGGAKATADEIRASLVGRLDDFKIPSQVVLVDAIPSGATGKVERGRLATVLAEQLRHPFIAPHEGTEADVAAIFREVLGIAQIGADDNFFAMGGDSIRGLQALARMRDQLRADLSIRDLFAGPTVAQVAREVERVVARADALALERILNEIEGLTDEEATERLRRGPADF